jgi:CIC family chloride channel protein
MAAVIAGSMRSPVGGMMIVVELTGDYGLILPLMLASALSVFLASRLQAESLYTEKLARLKVKHRPAVDPEQLARLSVGDVVEPAPQVMESTPLNQVAGVLQAAQTPAVAVVDSQGKYVGLIRPIDLDLNLGADMLSPLILAADLIGSDGHAAGLDDDLGLVYSELTLSEVGAVPVVAADGRFVGLVRQSGLMRRYRKQLLNPRAAD